MSAGLRRLWGGVYELAEMLEAGEGGMGFAVRDFALLTLAGQLSASFPGQLIFKGGFVLRHAHGHLRFSKDVDATRAASPSHKLDADEVAKAIRGASIQNVVRFVPEPPATDSARSLDFDKVRVTGDVFPDSEVQVEVSYREAVLGTPLPVNLGAPFYEPFEILTMEMDEMAAEKLRALAQRVRDTDLADLAVMLGGDAISDAAVATFAAAKFELVKQGHSNRLGRIERNIEGMRSSYDNVVPQLFPEAPSYQKAVEIVLPRIQTIVP